MGVKASPPLLVLAPMAEITDAPFRQIAREHGADAVVTEMISAAGLVRGNRRARMMLEHAECERPLAVQLYGGDADEMAEAARIVAHSAAKFGGFVEININAGCPVPKVTKCGGGSALIRAPEKIAEMVVKMKAAAGGLPVSVKTRVGLRPGNVAIFDILQAVEEAGASSIVVHGRYAVAGHGGPPDIPLLAETVARAKIPVIVNGGTNTPDDAVRIARETGAAGLMVGRAAIGKPFVFDGIKNKWKSSEVQEVREVQNSGNSEVLVVFTKHIGLIVSHYKSLMNKYPELITDPEKFAVRAFVTHLFRYFTGVPGANNIRRNMNSCRNVGDIFRLLECC